MRVRNLIVFFSEMLNTNKNMLKRAINANKPGMNVAMDDKCMMDTLVTKYNKIAKSKNLSTKPLIDVDYTDVNDQLLTRAYDGLLHNIERIKIVIREEEEEDTMLYGEYDDVFENGDTYTTDGWIYTFNNDTLTVALADKTATTLPETLPYNFIKDSSDNDAYPVTSISGMFQNCINITEIDLNDWDTSMITDMSSAFNGCTNLEVLNIDKWNTSNVTTLNATFNDCAELTTLDVSNWDVSNVIDLNNAFQSCYKLKILNLDNWDVRSITTMDTMFESCGGLTTLNVRWSNMPPIKDINTACHRCNQITSLDLTTWAFRGAGNWTFANEATTNSINSILENLTEITIQWGVFSYVRDKLLAVANNDTWYEKESGDSINDSTTWNTSWGLVATFVRNID